MRQNAQYKERGLIGKRKETTARKRPEIPFKERVEPLLNSQL
jgi:hypothetical protein